MVLNQKRIIYLMIFLNPFFEMCYSVLLRMEIRLPVSQLLRLIMMVTLLSFVKKKKTIRKIIRYVGVYLTIWILQIIMGFSRISFSELTFILKLIYSTSLISVFSDYLETELVCESQLIRIVIYSTFIMMFSICISPLNLGYEAWKDTEYRTGYVGWFMFGNYLTISLLITLCLLIYLERFRYKYIWILFNMVSLILLGNKAGLVGLTLITVSIGFYYLVKNKNTRRKILIIILAIIIFCTILPVLILYLGKYIQDQISLFYSYGYTNIWSFLLSNRDLQVNYIKRYIEAKQYNMVLGALIGYGHENIIGVIKQFTGMQSLEMDMHGLKYYVGYIPCFIWCGIYIKNIFGAWNKFWKEKDIKSMALFLGVLIGVSHSIFTGHVIFESLTIVYFAVISSIANSSKGIVCNAKEEKMKNIRFRYSRRNV